MLKKIRLLSGKGVIVSGGRFDYIDSRLKSEIFGWESKCSNVFEDREISELIFDVLDLIHDFDRYTCGDTGEDTWFEAKKAFKEKWFGKQDERIKHTIDAAIEEVRQELYKTYSLEAGEQE